MMKIKLLADYLRTGAIILFLLNYLFINAQVNIHQTGEDVFVNGSEKDGPTISLFYKDSLSLPSFTEFSLPVKMVTGEEISAISLGFYYPPEYLKITDMILADSVQGYNYSDTNGLFLMAWSSINPITIPDSEILITLRMKTLDMTGLTGTIKLGIYESSEFADKWANIIEGVVLEVPEIRYLSQEPVDTTSGHYVKVYPNPFDDYTVVYFYLKTESRVKISLCNLAGMDLKRVADETFPKGEHQVKLYAVDLSKGIYLLKFELINNGETSSKSFKIFSIR